MIHTRVLEGDCKKVLSDFPAESVDLIVTKNTIRR